MSSGERPIGAAKGKQSDTEALCQPPPPRGGNRHFVTAPPPPLRGVTSPTKRGRFQGGRGVCIVRVVCLCYFVTGSGDAVLRLDPSPALLSFG